MDLPVALCVVGRDGCLWAVNNYHAILAGRSVRDLIGVPVAELNPQGGENVRRDFRVFDAGGTVPNHEIEIRGRNYQVMVSPIRDTSGAVVAITVVHIDISEQKKAQEKNSRITRKLRTLTTTDHLTGLYNRRYFDSMLNELVQRSERSGDNFSIVMIDIDFFKPYNDLYGHRAGDACLRRVGRAIRGVLRRDEAALCRYGGEEFVVAFRQPDPALAVKAAERARAAVMTLAEPHEQGIGSVVTVSCGIANSSLFYADASDGLAAGIVTAADQALYTAKRSGRNRIQLFGGPEGMPLAAAG